MDGSQTHTDVRRRMQTHADASRCTQTHTSQTASSVWADTTSRHVQTLETFVQGLSRRTIYREFLILNGSIQCELERGLWSQFRRPFSATLLLRVTMWAYCSYLCAWATISTHEQSCWASPSDSRGPSVVNKAMIMLQIVKMTYWPGFLYNASKQWNNTN